MPLRKQSLRFIKRTLDIANVEYTPKQFCLQVNTLQGGTFQIFAASTASAKDPTTVAPARNKSRITFKPSPLV
jgi:hypothetical protein